MDITAVITKVTCDLPLAPVSFNWTGNISLIYLLPIVDLDYPAVLLFSLTCFATASGMVPQMPLQPLKLNSAGCYAAVPVQPPRQQHTLMSLLSTVLLHQEMTF